MCPVPHEPLTKKNQGHCDNSCTEDHGFDHIPVHEEVHALFVSDILPTVPEFMVLHICYPQILTAAGPTVTPVQF